MYKYGSKEKRRFIRVPTSVNVQFRSLEYDNPIDKKLSKDISIGGIRFLSNRFVPVSSHLKMEIKLMQFESPIQFICRAVWGKSLYNDESYEIGAEICEINPVGKKRLKNYVATHISD